MRPSNCSMYAAMGVGRASSQVLNGNTITVAQAGFPWTTEVLALWVGLTVPIGVAIIWFWASNRERYGPGPKPGIYASAALWVMMTVAMIVWAATTSLSVRVITLDSAVNLGATAAATLSGALLFREAQDSAWTS